MVSVVENQQADNKQVAAGGFFANSTGNDPDDGPTGLGHMSDVPVSAFDPLFFLHHW